MKFFFFFLYCSCVFVCVFLLFLFFTSTLSVFPNAPFFGKPLPLQKMKRLLQGCSSVAATMQQSNIYAKTGGDKEAN